MAKRILEDGGIRTSAGIPGSNQVKHTAAQRIVAQLCVNGKKARFGLLVSSRISRRLKYLGGRWSPTRKTDQ